MYVIRLDTDSVVIRLSSLSDVEKFERELFKRLNINVRNSRAVVRNPHRYPELKCIIEDFKRQERF